MTRMLSTILNMSLTGSVVIAVVLLARLCLKRAPKIYSYGLWAVVLFRLLCPLSITAGLSVLKPIPVTTTPGISTVAYGPVQQAVRYSNVVAEVRPELSAEPEKEEPKPAASPMEMAAYIWLAGASLMALYSAVQYAVLKRRLAESIPCREGVYLSDRIPTPFVMGIIRPRIYLPTCTPIGERPFILAHELHHIRRLDPLWKLLGYLALCLHWFNPLVWLAFCLAGKDMEMSCDEAVLKRLGEGVRADYAQALLRLATHKRIVSGMPLAFGEGDTKGRVRNMARWKKPKVWVSVLCAVVCVGILAACALNPRQEETPLEDLTRITGPAGIGAWDLFFTLPEGCTYELSEKDGGNWKDSRSGCIGILTDGSAAIGGLMAFPIPEGYGGDGWDWFRELDFPEWKDDTLGYYADRGPRGVVSVEFFSDVPEGQPRTVRNLHTLYAWEGWVYDLWFDELTVNQRVKSAILDSVSLAAPKPVSVSVPYRVGALPAGFSCDTASDGSIEILSAGALVGGITGYSIPQGVYDPNDDIFLWLEDVGIPDLEDKNLTVTGGISDFTGGWKVTVVDDLQSPKVQRTHRFKVSGDMVYDFWLDDLAVDTNTQFAIEDAVTFIGTLPEPKLSEEEEAFRKCQAVMQGLQDGGMHIRTLCRYQNHPGENYTEDFYFDENLGFLKVTTTAGGETRGELYAEDRYFVGEEKEGALTWREQEPESEFFGPWLGSFYFVKHNVTYLETRQDEEGENFFFKIDRALLENDPPDSFYFATFYFEKDGSFRDVSLYVNPDKDKPYTLTESIVTADQKAVEATIQNELSRAAK